MNTCRLCSSDDQRLLIKYGIRHYAHAACGLERWGAGFFDRLSSWQLSQFPYMVAVKAGLGEDLARRIGAQEG